MLIANLARKPCQRHQPIDTHLSHSVAEPQPEFHHTSSTKHRAPMARNDDGRAPTATGGRRRVVLFPFPFGSHITQMLQLGELLRARGLRVTVLHTDFNAPEPTCHPDLTFVSIRESLPAAVVSTPDMVEQMMALNAACEAPFQAALADETLLDVVACVVVDGQWHRMLGAAASVAVPALVLRADGAATFLSMLASPRLVADGYYYYCLPVRDDERRRRMDEVVVPGLEPLRVRDLIRVDGSADETVLRFIAANVDAVRASAAGVVLNTFDGIEGTELAKIRLRELPGRPVFAVGPLHLQTSSPAGARGQFQEAPDRSCLAWLDARAPRSVLYVSMGSVARVDRAAFEETAWALAASGVPFLWVLRRGSVVGAGEDEPEVPEELRETVRRRGKVVGWAPQREVLAHPAVGGFWTHCGWNSMVEAIAEGVPMLVQPCFGEQIVNARYVTHQWGVGLEVGRPLERTAMARMIRRLMVVGGGEMAAAGPPQGTGGPRERARVLMTMARECAAEGGAASVALDGLVEYISSL